MYLFFFGRRRNKKNIVFGIGAFIPTLQEVLPYVVFLLKVIIRIKKLSIKCNSYMTHFEIECKSGGHSVTKKFLAVLQVFVSIPKL